MHQLQPVLWAKGTLLTPQHLQQHDLFLESLLSFRLENLSFRPWGFAKLQIDQEALAGGAFALHSASGIFPDGLLFDIPASDQGPEPRQLSFTGDQKVINVHLAVPAYRPGGQNISSLANGIDARYSADAIGVRDETTGTSERLLQVARKNLRFLTGEETRASVPSLRIARIRKAPGGALELDNQYIPPLLDIAASTSLMSILRGLFEILNARRSDLSGMRRQKNRSLADFPVADIANFWLLYTINSWLPEIRHQFETRRGHPEHSFRVLSMLAGALTTFSQTVRLDDLPVYEHDNLGECFRNLDSQIREMLKAGVGNFVSIPLKQTAPFIYAARIDDEKLLRNTKMYLAISAEAGEADVIQKTPNLVKMSSIPNLDHLVKNALPGLSLRHVQPPSAIPVKLDYQYFSINQAGTSWEGITRARNIAAFVSAELPEPKLELLVLLPESEQR
jgi:type VI secretion system protein ImpJ